MVVTAKQLKEVIGLKTFNKLFNNGNPTAWVTFKIDGWDIEYSPLAGKYYLGWTNN